MPNLAGYDGEPHDRINEALKKLNAAQESYEHAIRSIEAQYLRSLESSHDGMSDECMAIKKQVALVRKQFLVTTPIDLGSESVQARF